MNVHISYKIPKTTAVEDLIQQQIKKLERYLRVFRPDLVRLRAVVEERAGPGIAVSLNLRLPTGQMTAAEDGNSPVAVIKASFDRLSEQLKKHKRVLRNRRSWSRRPAELAPPATVPFEDTVAAMRAEVVTGGDVAGYIDVNLSRLQRFVERELNFRESQGTLEPGQLTVDDVVDEAIADALDEQHDPPERLRLEPWLYRLSVRAISRLAAEQSSDGHVPLDRAHAGANVQASDEARLQFHQPDDILSEESLIPDVTASTPEELAAQDELIELVESTLGQVGRGEREAFILFTIQGFTADEICSITGQTVEQVRDHIRTAREHLRHALPLKGPFSERMVKYPQNA